MPPIYLALRTLPEVASGAVLEIYVFFLSFFVFPNILEANKMWTLRIKTKICVHSTSYRR